MLKKGEYTIVDLLCVSTSLLEQKNSVEDPKFGLYDVYKSVLESKDQKVVAYLLGDIEVGPSSIIKIHADTEYPLLYKNDYTVIRKTDYTFNKKLVEKLFSKI